MERRRAAAAAAIIAVVAAGSAIVSANGPARRTRHAASPLPEVSARIASERVGSGGPCDRPVRRAREIADDLLTGRYELARFPAVTLPADLRWDEDPFHDPNWPYNLHTLRFANVFWAAWEEAEDRRYRERYEFVLRDWYEDNPRPGAPSKWSWADHSTAWRGVVYACALERLPGRPWLREAAALHGRVLADPAFFVGHGNHALNQAVGLLELGCALDVRDWRSLAERRIDALATESIDAQGVTNEQAIGYQWYNFRRYSQARDALRACGMTPPRSLDRVDRMPGFLAFAALPNGRWELIGDTLDDPLSRLRGTVAEYAATAGAFGKRPSAMAALFNAGFAFMRSGWGDARAFPDETALSVRFGPARRFHGHPDAAALTLYAFGDRILVDPGLYRYRNDRLRLWFKSGDAHNTIAVDGRPMAPGGATRVLSWRDTPEWTYVAVAHEKIPGTSVIRRVFYSRALDVVIVDDDVRNDRASSVRQWWHLHPDARPHFTSDGFFTERPGSGANAWVVQLDGRVQQNVVRGSMNPVQGWMSFDYGEAVPASAVAVRRSGAHVRFLTLIVPSRSAARSWTVSSLIRTDDGFVLVIERNGLVQRITVAGREATARVL